MRSMSKNITLKPHMETWNSDVTFASRKRPGCIGEYFAAKLRSEEAAGKDFN